ncbi:hypothetical protein P389DRAFT_76523 [Cystobasidium minutum MCA 4210]|uniref:uncharacterized protein n=1 Tax=Cystobasidium minutum MCA 4210 TaxID=1397322 RepID=UPI0034CFDB05|eukprot:jgi/Rhomi1/76523/CE76522_2781
MVSTPATICTRLATTSRPSTGIKAIRRPFSSSIANSAAHGISRCGVVGAGQMGLGIAYVAAKDAKVEVVLSDASEAALNKGLAFMNKLLEKDVKKSKISSDDAQAIKDRVKTVNSISAFGQEDVQLVMEAVSESLPLKQKIFSELASQCSPETILATNTSSISIAKIAASAVASGSSAEEKAKSSSRVLGIHWMNPVPQMKLVEIIPCLQTSPEITARSTSFAEACNKQVTTSADTPGFLANRILMPYINEAIVCLETGVGSKEDLDTTAKLGFGHPMGPLTLADFIGLDTCYAIMQTLYTETADSKYRPSVLLGRMVDAGFLGKKSGKGFFDYSA